MAYRAEKVQRGLNTMGGSCLRRMGSSRTALGLIAVTGLLACEARSRHYEGRATSAGGSSGSAGEAAMGDGGSLSAGGNGGSDSTGGSGAGASGAGASGGNGGASTTMGGTASSVGGAAGMSPTSDTATVGAGGAASTEGASSAGGTSSAGGAANTEGASSAGGAANTDGTSSAGGTSSTGGTGGATATSGGSGGTGSPSITVDLAELKQEIAGFGIGNRFQSALSNGQADFLFGTDDGQIGLSIFRIGMNSQGDPDNDVSAWADIESARARGVETFIATVSGPPAEYKSSGTLYEGALLPQYYDDWAEVIADFPALVAANTTAELYAMSPQNEPDFVTCGVDEPCSYGNFEAALFTGGEYVEFMKVVGPELHAAGVEVIGGDAAEWMHLWSDASAVGSEPSNGPSTDPLDCGFPPDNCSPGNPNDGYDYGHALYADEDAWDAFDILGTHQYDSQVAERWPTDVPERKPVWQTEMGGIKWWPEQGPSVGIDNAIAVAGWIHDALTVGEASAWLWRQYRASTADDNSGLVLLDGGVTKRRWTLGNYSRFIRPGYTRVDVSGDIPEPVLLSAFRDPGSKVVIVAINRGNEPADLRISIAGGTAPATLTPYVTSASDNLEAKAAVAVTDGSFTAALGSESVTTFVGG